MRKNQVLMMFMGVLLVGVTLTGCTGQSKKDQLMNQLDSLAMADSLHKEDVKSMTDFVYLMSNGLDSITAQEGVINATQKEGGKVDKEKLRAQLQTLAQLVKRQRDRISTLEKEMEANKGAFSERLKKLVANYKAQLEAKDKQIAELNKQLNDKNASIAELNASVDKLTASNTELSTTVDEQSSTIDEQSSTISTQSSTISTQDATINRGYVAMGTASELKSKGIIKGGFLAKKKVNVQDLNTENFSAVDIRQYNNIKLNSSNPKVISQMPEDSYTIVKNGDNTSTLRITNTARFWSVTRYLVVKL